MPLSQLRNVNFGSSKLNATGSSGVGYQLLDFGGAPIASRTTSGVYQSAPGIYAAYIQFPDDFRGQILWDTGAAFPKTYYAADQYNVEENDPKVASTYSTVQQMSGVLNALYDIQYGRWKIENNQMIFYKDDNLTEVARYDLFDENGTPTIEAVFERIKV